MTNCNKQTIGSMIQELAQEYYSDENRDIETIFRERIKVQRDFIFCFLRDLLVTTFEEFDTNHGKEVVSNLNPEEFSLLVSNSERFKQLIKEKKNDEKTWLPLILIFVNAEGPPGIIHQDEPDNPAVAQETFRKLLNTIITGQWSLRITNNKPLNYGWVLFMALDNLLSEKDWTKSTYTLLTTIDDSVRDFIFFSATGRVNFTRVLEKQGKDIKNKKSTKQAVKSRGEKVNVRHLKTAKFVLGKLHTGQHDKLEGMEISSLIGRAGVWIEDHNLNLRNGKQKLSPTSANALTNVLTSYLTINSKEKLPDPKKITIRQKYT